MELTVRPSLLWFIGAYAVLMALMAIYYSKAVKTSDDFILAGRDLGSFVLAGTLIATWCGSGTVTGGPTSLAYTYGLWPAILFGVPSIIGILIMYVIAPKVRDYGKYTVSELLEIKYGPTARVISSIIIILAFVGIAAYQYTGLGYVLNVSTGISVELGTIISAVLMIFLALSGGLKSVAPTDAASAVIMLIGLLIAVPSIINIAGGWSNVVANVPPAHNTLTGGLSAIGMLGFYLPLFMLLLGDQNMYQRLAASRNSETSKVAIFGWLIGLIIIMPCVSLLAFTGRSLFHDIQPGMAIISTTTVLPVFVGGLLLASIAAFIVTTGNSYLLSCATNVTYDIYVKYIRQDANDKQKLIFTRLLVVILGALAYILVQFFPSILSLQMYAYTLYGASLTPAMLAVFFWKRVNKVGGIASMVTGAVSTLIWEIPLAKPLGINSVIVALPLAVIALYLGTVLTSKKDTKIESI